MGAGTEPSKWFLESTYIPAGGLDGIFRKLMQRTVKKLDAEGYFDHEKGETADARLPSVVELLVAGE